MRRSRSLPITRSASIAAREALPRGAVLCKQVALTPDARPEPASSRVARLGCNSTDHDTHIRTHTLQIEQRSLARRVTCSSQRLPADSAAASCGPFALSPPPIAQVAQNTQQSYWGCSSRNPCSDRVAQVSRSRWARTLVLLPCSLPRSLALGSPRRNDSLGVPAQVSQSRAATRPVAPVVSALCRERSPSDRATLCAGRAIVSAGARRPRGHMNPPSTPATPWTGPATG